MKVERRRELLERFAEPPARRRACSTWIGLRQLDTATAPAQGRENHDEQCGKLQSDGTWDDVTCGAMTGFLCER